MKYWVDVDDRLVAIDDEWRSFAIANGAPELASPSVLGRPIASFCSDAATNDVWRQIFSRARAGEGPRVEIRCDGPDERRLFELVLAHEGDRVCITSVTLSEEARAHVRLVEAPVATGDDLLVCCSWCKKWNLPSDGWLEVEEFVAKSRLFDEAKLPGVSHAICPECRARFGRDQGA